jgi:hypothetical protein
MTRNDTLAGSPTPADDTKFWGLATPLLAQLGVTRSTMMGFPCLRFEGT